MKCYNKDCEYFEIGYASNCREIGMLNKEKCNRFLPGSMPAQIMVPLSSSQVDRIHQIFKAKAEASSNYDQQSDYHEQADYFHEILKEHRGK